MKIKNAFLLLLLVVLSNGDFTIAMDKSVPVSEELSPVDMKLIFMSRANKDIKQVLSDGANPNIFDVVGIKTTDINTIGFTPLLYACMFCNIDNTKLLLDHGADVNLKSKRSNIPPIYEVLSSPRGNAESRYKLARLLIERGADVAAKGPGNHSLLQVAIKGNNKLFANELLSEKKVDINTLDTHGNNALTDAVLFADEDLIRKLFDAGVVPVIDKDGISLIHIAVIRDDVKEGDIRVLDLLIDKGGYDINAVDKDGQSPLHYAGEGSSYAVVKKLLDLGADPRIKDNKGRTALQLSAHNPSTTVNMLLKKAKQPVVVQKIVKKEEKKKEEVLKKEGVEKPVGAPVKKKKRLKKKKPQAEVRPIETQVAQAMGKPVLVSEELRPIDRELLAASRTNENVKSALLKGANPNIFDDIGINATDMSTIGFTPLLYACVFCSIDNAKLLLDHEADVNLKSKNTNIPPIYQLFSSNRGDAVQRYDFAQFLIAHGADVTAKGPKNHSLLQRAIQGGNTKFVQFLLKEGKGDVNSFDEYRLNALSSAIMSGLDLDLIRALFDVGCMPISDDKGASLMHHAVESIDSVFGGNLGVLDLLFKKGLDVNAKDIHGQTPLHWASELCSYVVVKKILDLGADPRIKDENGKTAFQLSANNINKSHKAVQLLLKNTKQPKKKPDQGAQAAQNQQPTGAPQETSEPKPMAKESPAREMSASDKPKKEKPSLKEKISAVKQTVVDALHPERREASILQAGRTYAVAAGAPAARAPQPEENLITLIDDRVDIVAYKWKPMSQTNPLIGLPYSKHVQEKMDNKFDVFHNFSSQVEEQLGSFMNAEVTQEATKKHSDTRKYTIPATIKTLNKEFVGRFEFVVRDGKIIHRFFKHDKQANEQYFEQKEEAPLLLPAAPTKYQEKGVDVKR